MLHIDAKHDSSKNAAGAIDKSLHKLDLPEYKILLSGACSDAEGRGVGESAKVCLIEVGRAIKNAVKILNQHMQPSQSTTYIT